MICQVQTECIKQNPSISTWKEDPLHRIVSFYTQRDDNVMFFPRAHMFNQGKLSDLGVDHPFIKPGYIGHHSMCNFWKGLLWIHAIDRESHNKRQRACEELGTCCSNNSSDQQNAQRVDYPDRLFAQISFPVVWCFGCFKESFNDLQPFSTCFLLASWAQNCHRL